MGDKRPRDAQLVVGVDDQELTLEQFGKMLLTYNGWGMRIEFVPDDELHRRPIMKLGSRQRSEYF